MASLSGVFSTFFAAEIVPFLKPSSVSPFPPSLRPLVMTPFPADAAANVRTVRSAAVTGSTASSTGKCEPRGIMKPRRVSPEMAELVGSPEISRTEALKRIWTHIKQHSLQDPSNKKIIRCDEKLKKIFAGRDQVGFLEIAGLISPHFLK